jgi:hypothetical protein
MRVPAMHGFPNRTPASTETPGKTSIFHLLGTLFRSESYGNARTPARLTPPCIFRRTGRPMIEQKTLEFRTLGRGTTDITAEVARAVAASGIRKGLCTVFLQHTTATRKPAATSAVATAVSYPPVASITTSSVPSKRLASCSMPCSPLVT